MVRDLRETLLRCAIVNFIRIFFSFCFTYPCWELPGLP
jgi:hypothetical protein